VHRQRALEAGVLCAENIDVVLSSANCKKLGTKSVVLSPGLAEALSASDMIVLSDRAGGAVDLNVVVYSLESSICEKEGGNPRGAVSGSRVRWW
jgi:hypothetical protein